ncbi:MAG: hypothetical protein ACOYXB_02285 [Bacteroidota bacterium]
MKRYRYILALAVLLFSGCREPVTYPDEPVISFSDFYLYITENELGVQTLTGDLVFGFTDGDGNVGLEAISDSLTLLLPDTVIYNLFLQTYAMENGGFVKVPEEEGGLSKYRIPYMDKSPLNGTITIKLEYPIIAYDTLFYTFYIYDRSYNRSNTDSSYVIVFTGISTNGDSVHFGAR